MSSIPKRRRFAAAAASALLLVAGLTSCAGAISAAMEATVTPGRAATTTSEPSAAGAVTRPEEWSEETHGSQTDPNYEVVFPDDEVKRITITISPEDWDVMQADMVDLFGEAGSGVTDGGFPGGFQPPAGTPPQRGAFEPPEGALPESAAGGFLDGVLPPPGQEQTGRPQGPAPDGRPREGGLGGGDLTPENPTWIPATVEFEGNTWTNVGVRYKGNSSLTTGWRSGTIKLPLKLDFDEFEDDYPGIEDQRFYGFKQLSLSNGFSDASFLRDAATSRILEEAGLPAARTAFYEVVLDYGEGPVTLGLYTMIEVVDDTVVERYFGSDDGNIYEGDGSAASFAAATYDQIEESFQKENNQDEADWSDIEALFDVLHDNQRTSAPESWRASLESVFGVDSFLEWLAISSAIQHWDSYGSMSHNYYLYHDPDSGQLEWISWDHNMAMSAGWGRGPGARSVSLDRMDVGDDWPLIRYLLDDPIYYARYLEYLAETIAGPFDPDRMAEEYQTMAELIGSNATAEVGDEAFSTAVQQLIEHAYQQADAVQAFLATSGGANTP